MNNMYTIFDTITKTAGVIIVLAGIVIIGLNKDKFF